MSGFIGIIAPKIEQLDVDILDNSIASLTSVCGDYSGAWRSEKADLRFGWLKVFNDTHDEHLPFTIDGNVRIVGDVRLDNRTELVKKLKLTFGNEISNSTPDSYLVLYAYKQWGESCLQCISGDYAFAIWNELEGSLFCARDHFGLVPFYYTQLNDRFLFTNFYIALKDVPDVITEMDDDVLADYFNTGINNRFDQTIYKNLRKLPPAHQLTYKDGVLSIDRYWQVPEQITPIRYKTTSEYVEHFYRLFEQSIRDRTRNNKIASALSGGMDSPAVTAIAKKILSEVYGNDITVKTFNIIYEQIITEKEGFFAKIVAKHLNLPIQQYIGEDYLKNISKPLASWLPEPVAIPHASAESEILKDVEAFSRTYLAGFGGDPLFLYDQSTRKRLQKQGGKIQSYKDEIRFYKIFGRFSGITLRTPLMSLFKRESVQKNSTKLSDKFSSLNENRSLVKKDKYLSHNATYHQMFEHPFWASLFESSYPGFSGYKVKVRQPFFSLDLFLFILALPPHILYNKALLRMAMSPYLPEQVIIRPKALIFKNLNLENLQTQKVPELLKARLLKEKEFFIGKIKIKNALNEINIFDALDSSNRKLLNILNLMSWHDGLFGK